ncbi:type II toxin-antitoxin system mRNA interferase toxin, RelE/StbE family [Candidatus Uhrbacteria bacterium]|nr:type II toxin-antitoxin system mRNA interferase toxin, RelE/StbE family [Candidatus Uhrbacteria bacterium]
MKVFFAPSFVRAYKNLPEELKQEVKEKITLFEKNPKQTFLKTHKLKGKLRGRQSFSVNYKYRIVFFTTSTADAVLLAVGDHDVYA